MHTIFYVANLSAFSSIKHIVWRMLYERAPWLSGKGSALWLEGCGLQSHLCHCLATLDNFLACRCLHFSELFTKECQLALNLVNNSTRTLNYSYYISAIAFCCSVSKITAAIWSKEAEISDDVQWIFKAYMSRAFLNIQQVADPLNGCCVIANLKISVSQSVRSRLEVASDDVLAPLFISCVDVARRQAHNTTTFGFSRVRKFETHVWTDNFIVTIFETPEPIVE